MADDKDVLDLNARHPDYLAQRSEWDKLSDLYEGADVVRANSVKYLPQTEMERRESESGGGKGKTRYQQRLESSPFINGVGRLTRYAMSNLFRSDVKLPEDSPDEIKLMFNNCDMLGTKMSQFVRNVSARAYVMGHYFVLVDMPDMEGVDSYQSQKDNKVHPYLVPIDPRNIINWSITKSPNGSWVFDWIIHAYTQYESNGPFSKHREVVYFKVWSATEWILYKAVTPTNNSVVDVTVDSGVMAGLVTFPQGSTLVEVNRGVNPIGEVPIVPIYSNLIRPMVSKPPLSEAADINLDHYRTYSMFNTGLMYHLSPVLALIGVGGDDEVKLNAWTAIQLPRDADAKYVEYQGGGLSIAKDASKELAVEMMEAGLRNSSFLGANTSAEARRLSRSDFHSFLIDVANNYEFGWSRVLELAGMWANTPLTEEQKKVSINRDFDVVVIDANQSNFLLKCRETGEISKKRFFEELQRGEVFDKSIVIEDEIKEAVKDGPSKPDSNISSTQSTDTMKVSA